MTLAIVNKKNTITFLLSCCLIMHASPAEPHAAFLRTPIPIECLSATQYGHFRHVLEFDSIEEVPECQPDDVLIRVMYCELNPVDLHKLHGGPLKAGQPTPSPLVVGFGGSGVIQDVGVNVPRDWKHQRVAFLCDPTRPGAYATHVLVHSRLVAPLPFPISFKHAATVPLSGCTAYEALLKLGLGNRAPLRGDDPTLLVVGGAGGVGSWATQLARALYPNLKIVTTASSEESQQWCRRMGANQVIRHEDVQLQLRGGRDTGSVDYVLCLAEPTETLFAALSQVIRPYGCICLVVSGDAIKKLDMGLIFFKSVTVTTETVFCSIRTQFRYIQPASEMEDLLEHMASDSALTAPLSPQLEGLSGAEDWKNALQEGGILDVLASGHARGKLVMKIGSWSD